MKKVIVFFDVEADLVSQKGENEKYLQTVFEILEEKKMKATLNTCGKVIEMFPAMFKKFAQAGHEISSHAYNHENIIELDKKDLNNVLEKTEQAIKKTCGQKPVGFRSPWLYTKPLLYEVLSERGYKWVSNKRIRRKEVLANPSFQFSSSTASKISEFLMSTYLSLQWQFFPKKQFEQNGLVHIPLLSSMDGELLGLIDPNQKSSQEQVNYVVESLKKQFFESNEHFNVTFHDWIVGSQNRTQILSETLDFFKKNNCEFLTAKELYL